MMARNAVELIVCLFAIFLIHSIQCTQTNDSNSSSMKGKSANVYNDTATLYECLESTSQDDISIARVVIERSRVERLQIKKLFELLYKKELMTAIRHRIYDNFRRIVVALFLPLYDYYAQELLQSIVGIGTDEDAIMEILIPMNNSDILNVCSAYEKAAGRTLLDDLSNDTSGQFWKLLKALLSASRDENGKVDYTAADRDSNDLIKATEGRKGHSKVEPVIEIFTTRSYPQLTVIFEAYKNKTKKNIWDSVEYHYDGEVKYAFFLMLRCVYLNSGEYYASLLKDSLDGLGTNDLRLIRIIVGRSEIDLGDIRRTYKTMYGVSLADDVADDTSGLYSDVLLGLINKA